MYCVAIYLDNFEFLVYAFLKGCEINTCRTNDLRLGSHMRDNWH